MAWDLIGLQAGAGALGMATLHGVVAGTIRFITMAGATAVEGIGTDTTLMWITAMQQRLPTLCLALP